MANVLPHDKQVMLVRALGMGTKIRHIEHILGIAQETVMRYQRLLGEMARDFLDEVQRDLECDRIEVDEKYSYVAAKKHNVDRMKKKNPDAGEHLHFLAVQPKSNFIIAYQVARSNSIKYTKRFMNDLNSRLKRGGDGEFTVKPTIITDGHGAYLPAIEEVFGTRVNYARLTKQHTERTEDGKKTRRRFKGVIREVLIGSLPDDDEFWSNNVESANRTARAQNSRLVRRTGAFSKNYEEHVGQYAFWILYHNYCIVPDRRFFTPAMCAGVTNKIFTAEDILELLEHYQRKSKEAGLLDPSEELPSELPAQPETTDPLEAPFWLYRNLAQSTVRIHRADCNNCRNGRGRGGEMGRSGHWYAARTLEEAEKLAEELEPRHHAVCSMCIGTRRSMGRRL
ncbi:MAG: hypothetical protein GC139_10970 [Sideroxydans sp.]|nr:hypothetical protein [Sideroxydans sp.]